MRAQRARGFTLVTAIFLIVVLALLVGYIVTIAGVGRATSTFALLGPRAHFAAASGLEWGITEVLTADACFPAGTSFTLGGGATGGFTTTLACNATAVTEGATTYNVFELTATASFGPPDTEDFFTRTVAATVSTAP